MSAAGLTTLFAWEEGALVKKLVVRCALARICGGCGASLARPIAFVGDAEEVERNAFHAPPLHATCADDVRRVLDPAGASLQVVLTSGFEFVRPASSDLDQQPRFVPNSLLG
jgi:hypothetical protein